MRSGEQVRQAGWMLLLLLLLPAGRGWAFDEAEAIKRLEAAPCGTTTVGERLREEINSHSRRDLGWQAFDSSGNNDLERSLRVSKSMEIRYRWRITPDGALEPQSEPARKLCQ